MVEEPKICNYYGQYKYKAILICRKTIDIMSSTIPFDKSYIVDIDQLKLHLDRMPTTVFTGGCDRSPHRILYTHFCGWGVNMVLWSNRLRISSLIYKHYLGAFI